MNRFSMRFTESSERWPLGVQSGDAALPLDTWTQGHPGATGPTGPTGAAGATGADGTTYTPSVSSSGWISWTNDGGKTNPATANIKGPTGATGATGAAGPTGAAGVPDKAALLNYIYPIGSIYMSVNSTSPASFLGGTWARIQDTFLLAAGSSYAAGATGGEAAHTLTDDEIPGHVHSIVAYDENGEDYSDSDAYLSFNFNTAMKGWLGHTGFTGGRVAHNNMPPYLAVYVWKRTK